MGDPDIANSIDKVLDQLVNGPVPVDSVGGSGDSAGEFEIDPDNSTETTLNAGEEFVGEFKPWDQNVGIAVALVTDVPGGVSGEGEDSLQVELSANGTDVGRTVNIDYPPGPIAGEGIQPVISREAEFYRVRYQNGDQDQSTFRLNTIKLPRSLQEQLRPIGDTVNDRTVANTVKSVISAKDPDGDYVPIGADRFDNLKSTIDSVGRDAYRYAVRGDSTLYGTQVVGSKVPQIDLQWHEIPVADEVLDTPSANDGTYSQLGGSGVFTSGTGPDAQYIGQTFQPIEYVSGFEIQFIFTGAYVQPPTSASDFLTLGLSNGDDGFEIGYKGTEFGIRHLARGSEQEFVLQQDFNLDKLDGNPESEYRRGGEPVAIDTTTENVWRIRFGWYGTAPTHIEVQAPDGHWVAVHKFDFTQEELPQTQTPNLPGRINIDKNSSDSTDIEYRSGAWYGGIVGNVGVAQQPDGDYVSEKASGQAFTEQELLTANETFTSDWVDTDGWESIEIQTISDQPSAENGVVLEFTDDVQSENPQPRANTVFEYTQDQVDANEALIAVIPTELDGFRLKYTNGPIGQNEFSASVTLRTSRIAESTTLTDPINNTDLAQTNRAIAAGQDGSGEFDFIGKVEDALKVSIDNQSVDINIDANNNWQTGQVEVSNLSAARIDPSPINDRKSIRIANEGPNDAEIYIGSSSSVTEDNGYPVDLEEEETLSISESAEVWAILSSSVTGATQLQTLDANSTIANNGVTNPDNAFTSNDTDAVFADQNDNAEYGIEDFTFSSGFSDIAEVRIGFEGSRSSGGTQTITHEGVSSSIQAGGTSIATDSTVISSAGDFYVATVAAKPTGADVTSVTGLGLTWTQQAQTTDATGNVRHETWIGEGTPTGNDTVTANFNQATTVCAIGVSRLSGVDLDDPVANNDTNSNNPGTPWSVVPAPNSAGDYLVGGAVADVTSGSSPSAGDVERVERQISTPSQLTFAMHTDEVTGSDEEINGNWGFYSDWAGSAVALSPAPLDSPEILLEYEVGAEGVGPTTLTQTLDNDTDQDFTMSVTGDRTWTISDIDSTTIFVTQNISEPRNADIDYVFMEVDEAEGGATQRVGIVEEGD